MLNLFTILVFLFVLLGVLGLRAFTNRARREEMVRERLTELLTQVEEEAKSVAPVEYPDESVLMGLDDYHGHFPKLHARIVPGVLIYQYIQAPQDFQFLVTDPTGLKVLGYAAASVAAGLFVTWLMVRRIQ